MNINNLLHEIKKNKLKVNTKLIQRAYEVALKAHEGQKREDGENFISHPLSTALILVEMNLDTATICAALLHDAIDDTPITLKKIKSEFGQEIAFLVKGVSKLGKLKYRGIERYVENLRKMFLAMAKDVRIIMIKLADRLHNMKTLDALPPRKQKRIAIETLEIYAPIAHRLGMGKLKGELEDLAFPYVHPKQHEWLQGKIQDRYQEREKYLKRIKPVIEKKLSKANIKYIDLHARAKRYYSLYKKLERYNMDFSKIYDLVALRIIVPNLEHCYAALGIIHNNWRPLPGRFRDYIAGSKANGYQSLHTTVFCIDGKITEFQIRTPQMHYEAEYGIAAHWSRPEEKGQSKFYGIQKPKLEWIDELKNWQKDISRPKEFLKSLKIDFFKYRIFVLTPKGDMVNLPEGATPVDFAYQIHTELGHRYGGAKVDGKIVPLSQPLYNGQIVEIILRKEAKPNLDWLKFVKTNYAKNKIKGWFKEQKEDKKEQKEEHLPQRGTKPEKEIIIQRFLGKTKNPIMVCKEENLVIKLAKCCNPIPGESILGYVTTLKSITVHHHKCPNIVSKNNKRILPVSWKNAVALQPTTLEILARDRIGLINDLTTILSKSRINISNLNATEPNQGVALTLLTIEVADIKQLNDIEKKLKEIRDVWEVKRV